MKSLKKYIKSILKEQNATRCLTNGAQFHQSIERDRIGIDVDLGFDLELSEREAIELETLLHNAVELVLRPYFEGRRDIDQEEIKSDGRKVVAFDFHDTLVEEQDDGSVVPREGMIEKLKKHYEDYSFIVIYTAAPETNRNLVRSQLAYLGIPYDVLAMEKPRFDMMYDDRYIGPSNDWV